MGIPADVLDIDDLAVFSTPEACRMARVSFRQIDYWARTGLIEMERPAQGSGSQRRWTGAQVRAVAMVGRLRELGVSRDAIEEVLAHVRGAADGALIVIGTASARVCMPGEIGEAITAADGAAIVVSPDALRVVVEDRGADRCKRPRSR